jgi:hypothetical protein
MKFVQKMLVALACLGVSSQALAYTWAFTNVTEKPVVISFKLKSYGYTYYDIVNPGENSTRFTWPTGSLKAGFCVSNFLIGNLEGKTLQELFGKTTLPTTREIEKVCGEDSTRAVLARVGKRDLPIKWISGEKWGEFDKASKDAINVITQAITEVGGEAIDLAIALSAEAATSGSTGGAAGGAAKKLQFGKILKVLNGVPGAIMTLAEKSRCSSRHFDILTSESGNLSLATKL